MADLRIHEDAMGDTGPLRPYKDFAEYLEKRATDTLKRVCDSIYGTQIKQNVCRTPPGSDVAVNVPDDEDDLVKVTIDGRSEWNGTPIIVPGFELKDTLEVFTFNVR